MLAEIGRRKQEISQMCAKAYRQWLPNQVLTIEWCRLTDWIEDELDKIDPSPTAATYVNLRREIMRRRQAANYRRKTVHGRFDPGIVIQRELRELVDWIRSELGNIKLQPDDPGLVGAGETTVPKNIEPAEQAPAAEITSDMPARDVVWRRWEKTPAQVLIAEEKNKAAQDLVRRRVEKTPANVSMDKNKAAQDLVRRRWEKTPSKERSEIARELARRRWQKNR